MKSATHIVICASLEFVYEAKKISSYLSLVGYNVVMPETMAMILNGYVSLEQIIKEKKSGEIASRIIKQESLKTHFRKISDGDSILVLNYTKNGIENYIGGQVLIEMAFAFILDKPIYLLHNIPKLPYSDVIKAMMPKLLQGDLNAIER